MSIGENLDIWCYELILLIKRVKINLNSDTEINDYIGDLKNIVTPSIIDNSYVTNLKNLNNSLNDINIIYGNINNPTIIDLYLKIIDLISYKCLIDMNNKDLEISNFDITTITNSSFKDFFNSYIKTSNRSTEIDDILNSEISDINLQTISAMISDILNHDNQIDYNLSQSFSFEINIDIDNFPSSNDLAYNQNKHNYYFLAYFVKNTLSKNSYPNYRSSFYLFKNLNFG